MIARLLVAALLVTVPGAVGYADTLTTFTAEGMFSDGVVLGGTMSVDVTAGCIGSSAGCPDTTPVALTISSHPSETFILGANPGPASATGIVTLPLISSPFCCADLSMQVSFQALVPPLGGVSGLIGYAGGTITDGFTDNVQNLGVVEIDTGLTGNFTGPVASTPIPAALPLFAGGLGALGLLGWRRKRKNNAAIAA